jgi:hypothetical protein
MTEADDLPPICAPATRALHAAGFTRLEQVAGVPECELAQLHGVGSKALRLLREALADRGLSFRLMPGPDSGGMDPVDVALRNETYRLFVTLGRAPTATETGAAVSGTAQEVRAGWQRLHAAHALVLDSAGAQIRMANPFSAVPTAYRVSAAGRWWYANCAWDAFGICAALHTDGRIATSCADCGKSVRVAVDGGRPHDGSLLFHCLVPARQWWDDITFT